MCSYEYGDEHSYSGKISVKWMEVPIQKFNAAIPHFVDLLKTHNTSLIKLRRLNQWEDMRKEHAAALRVANQLTSLLTEMDNLRGQIVEADLIKFDKLIASSKQQAKTALQSFKDIPVESWHLTFIEKNHVNFEDNNHMGTQKQLEIVADLSEEVKKQEQLAASMERLQEDVQDLNSMFQDLSQIVHDQGEAVGKIEDNVEATHENVVEGERMLSRAVKYKSGMYPLVGAVVGTVLGGPIGLVAGAKLGSLTAVGCGLLGFTGGRFLKNQNAATISEADENRKNLAI